MSNSEKPRDSVQNRRAHDYSAAVTRLQLFLHQLKLHPIYQDPSWAERINLISKSIAVFQSEEPTIRRS